MEQVEQIKYCLYARKSSEQDERQAMSIDSQLKEKADLAPTLTCKQRQIYGMIG